MFSAATPKSQETGRANVHNNTDIFAIVSKDHGTVHGKLSKKPVLTIHIAKTQKDADGWKSKTRTPKRTQTNTHTHTHTHTHTRNILQLPILP